jgi:hypothetical protein
MTFFALLGHMANFVAPALVMAALLWLAPRIARGKRPVRIRAAGELGLLAGAGVAVLLLGLIVFGRDGKMFTYAALVLTQGTLAWWIRSK